MIRTNDPYEFLKWNPHHKHVRCILQTQANKWSMWEEKKGRISSYSSVLYKNKQISALLLQITLFFRHRGTN